MNRRPRLVGMSLGLLLGGCASYYQGPPSDHFDGERFFNPGYPAERPPFAFLRWQLTQDRQPWPDWIAETAQVVPPLRVDGDSLRVTFINHATVLLQTQGLNILTDPQWSERASPLAWLGPERVHAPGVRFEDLPPIDVVLVSHNHYDHLDLATLSRLGCHSNPLILVPLGNDTIIRHHDPDLRVQSLDWFEGAELANGVNATLVPVQHWSARGLFDRNRALWGGFVVATAAGNVYFAGDTGYGDGQWFRDSAQRFGPFRLALLPIGAFEPRWFMRYSHMNPEEAVLAHQDLGEPPSLGIHFGTFQLTDEARDTPVRDLATARKRYGINPEQFRVPEVGTVWEVPLVNGTAGPG